MLRQLLLSDLNDGNWESVRGWDRLAAEFPMVAVQPLVSGEGAQVLRLEVEEWRAPDFDPFAWDPRVFSAAGVERLALHLVGASGEPLAAAALEILTRYQGLVARRNAASSGSRFDHLLERHRALHDLGRPRARAHYQHSLDTWQWVLRLAPEADLAVQVAALFHDGDDPAFEEASLTGGEERTRALLSELEVDAATRERACELVTRQERPGCEAALALLDEADALSCFSLHSPGFLRCFNPAHARHQVASALMRPRPEHDLQLERMYLAPRVRTLLEARRLFFPTPVPPRAASPDPS
jgi:hypothetical protein